MILNDVAVLANATTLLLETVSKRMSTHNETLFTMDWNAVEAETASVFKIPTPLVPLSFSLISHIILGTSVDRELFVKLDNGENSTYTYGELEETGYIALDTNISFARIPYSLLIT